MSEIRKPVPVAQTLVSAASAPMPTLVFLLFATLPAFAAITGTVTNRTTGQPAAGAPVSLYSLANGFELVEEAKADAQGNFTINQTPAGPGLIRTTVDGVTYNHVLSPGSPTSGIAIDVFNASKQPGDVKITKHMLLFEPAGGQMGIQETFLFTNPGKTAWNDAANGTLRFYLPAPAGGKASVNATPPGGLPIGATVVKTSKPDIMGVDFAIRPGETRFDVAYAVPYTDGAPYEGKIVTRDENTYLIAPNGVTLTGAGLNDLGAEPQTQARIYGLTGASYKISLTGAPVEAAAADAGDGSEGGPQFEEVPPHAFTHAKLIVGLGLAILALCFAILYRAPGKAAKETDARGRR